MAELTADGLTRLHQRIDELAIEAPRAVAALALFLENYFDDDEPPDDAEDPAPLTPAGSAA